MKQFRPVRGHRPAARGLPGSPAARLVAALAALVAGLVVVLVPGPATAAPVCKVDYTTNQWPGGFTASVRLTNLGSAVSGWTLSWTAGTGQQITNAWNAQVSQSGATVTATNVAWNGSLATGGAADFGFQGTWSGSLTTPSDWSLNGVPCGGTSSPSPSPSSSPSSRPTPSPSPTPSPTVDHSPSPSPSPSSSPSPSPSPSPSGTPSPSGCSGTGLVVCSGFEDQSGTPSGEWQVTTPNCSGTGTATIDTATAHSGGRSLRINGGGNYCNHIFAATTKNVSAVSPVVYGRMWVRHTTALPAGHVAMITMSDSRDGGKDLRIGGQNGALQWNRESDDATLPEQSPSGVALSAPLPVNRWVCLRFQIDTTQQAMRTYLDDQEIAGLRVDGTPTTDVDAQWLRRSTAPRPTTFRLGWESYGGDSDTIWYDDVALGSSPIGC
ncbi:cellulose-binding domain-containing protein [Microbispora siamensis]